MKTTQQIKEEMMRGLTKIIDGWDIVELTTDKEQLYDFISASLDHAFAEWIKGVKVQKRIMVNPIPDSDLIIRWNSAVDELNKKLQDMEKLKEVKA